MSVYEYEISEFDSVEAMKGIVEYLSQAVGQYLANIPNTEQSDIRIGYQNVTTADYPRITLAWQGDSTTESLRFAQGAFITEDTDGNETFNTYVADLIKYKVDVIVDSGAMTEVLQGKRKSSNYIAHKIKKSLRVGENRDTFHKLTNSTLEPIGDFVVQTDIDGTRAYDSCVITLVLSTIDADITTDAHYFDAVGIEGANLAMDDQTVMDTDNFIATKIHTAYEAMLSNNDLYGEQTAIYENNVDDIPLP